MNAQQFTQYTRQHRQHLRNVALRFFHEQEVAEDILQDTLLRLWMARERLAEAQDFVALGTRIAKNLCVNEWKRRQTQAVAHDEPPEMPSQHDTSASVEERDHQQLLQHAIAQCSPTEQRIFLLATQEQQGAAQIAEILQCKTTTVSQTLSKVRRKIFNIIQSSL